MSQTMGRRSPATSLSPVQLLSGNDGTVAKALATAVARTGGRGDLDWRLDALGASIRHQPTDRVVAMMGESMLSAAPERGGRGHRGR